MSATYTVDKSEVYNDVGRTTGYTGAKMQGDDDAYSRISTVAGDDDQLERFWTEACDSITDSVKEYVSSVTTTPNYSLTLSLPSNYDASLTNSITSRMKSYIVASMLAKWFRITNKAEATDYAQEAAALLTDIIGRIYHRTRPTRTQISITT